MQAVKQQLLIQLKELIPSSAPAGKTASERTLQEGTVIRAWSWVARSDATLTLLQNTTTAVNPSQSPPPSHLQQCYVQRLSPTLVALHASPVLLWDVL